jgi:chemotaxis protein MotA
MEHGNFKVLIQPAELIIIFGAAVGTVVAANPISTLKKLADGILGLLSGSPYSKALYLETLKMLYDVFSNARRLGVAKLEEELDHPEKSAVFTKYPKFIKDHHALDFLCDTLRMTVSGGVEVMDIEQMMEVDLDVHHREAHAPVAALSTMADSLPGLGIVAAVLGVVITMGALGGPKEEIGHKVAAALVGTFLGILLCYGIFGPMASAIGKQNDGEGYYYGVLRMAALAYCKGMAPIMAVELARRAIPTLVRPRFTEMEQACRGGGSAKPAAEAA